MRNNYNRKKLHEAHRGLPLARRFCQIFEVGGFRDFFCFFSGPGLSPTFNPVDLKPTWSVSWWLFGCFV